MSRVEFASRPAVGLALLIGGQRFELIRYDPYTRKDGSLTELAFWSAECAECAAPFEIGQTLPRLPELRTCALHRGMSRTKRWGRKP